MSTNHYDFNTVSAGDGAEMNSTLRQLAEAWDKFTRLRGVLISKKVIGASGAAEFESITSDYGFPTNDVAQSSFGEIDSAFGNGNAAITQMLNRHL